MDAVGQPSLLPKEAYGNTVTHPYLGLKTVLKTSQPVNEKDVQDFQLSMKLDGV